MSNSLIPDHNPDVFRSPIHTGSKHNWMDNYVEFLIGGFQRWDSEYFLHIAKFGYTYENCAAFFPLYPLAVAFLTSLTTWTFGIILSDTSRFLLTAVSLNLVLFPLAAVLLLQLSHAVLQDDLLAVLSTALFCVNPSSVFMCAPYSETMFACLSFSAMLSIHQKSLLVGAVTVALASLARSNGLVLTGFLIHQSAAACLRHVITKHHRRVGNIGLANVTCIVTNIVCCVFSIMPFVCYQYYVYSVFCFPDTQSEVRNYMDADVARYGHERGYRVVGDPVISDWCLRTVPLSYTSIQSSHWGIGFMSYYQLKQAPNFLLAFPIATMSLTFCYLFCVNQPHEILTLGMLRVRKEKVETIGSICLVAVDRWGGSNLTVYVLHLLFLTVFAGVFMHIQVM